MKPPGSSGWFLAPTVTERICSQCATTFERTQLRMKCPNCGHQIGGIIIVCQECRAEKAEEEFKQPAGSTLVWFPNCQSCRAGVELSIVQEGVTP